jgi:uroporphyrinogen decarboxylase
MNSLERTVAALSHREGDRPPVFLLFTMHGAKVLGLSLREYFSSAEHVIEGQWRLRQQFGHDCLYAFHYASLELEAWGCGSSFIDEGPPNLGDLLIHRVAELDDLEAPRLDHPSLRRVLRVIEGLHARARGEAPVVGVVLSPYSVPVMQLGFGPWLELLHEARVQPGGQADRRVRRLLALNEDFAARWGAAQLAAGATALVYFDPLFSPTMTSDDLALPLALPMAQRFVQQFAAPVGLHFASGRVQGRWSAALSTGAAVLSVSAEDDLAALKATCHGRAALLGNLNGVQMPHWSARDAHQAASRALTLGAEGGGFVLADNHGELPFHVGDEVLHAVVRAADDWAAARRVK